MKALQEPIGLLAQFVPYETSMPTFASAEDEAIRSETEGRIVEGMKKALATLTPREEQILRMRFGIGEESGPTLEETGRRFAVTRERIRQIEAKALRKLRCRLRWRDLDNGCISGP